jgi:hypothetical protein
MESIRNAFENVYPFRTTLLRMLRPTDIVMIIQSLGTELSDMEKVNYLKMWRQMFVDHKAYRRLLTLVDGVTLMGKDLSIIIFLIEEGQKSTHERNNAMLESLGNIALSEMVIIATRKMWVWIPGFFEWPLRDTFAMRVIRENPGNSRPEPDISVVMSETAMERLKIEAMVELSKAVGVDSTCGAAILRGGTELLSEDALVKVAVACEMQVYATTLRNEHAYVDDRVWNQIMGLNTANIGAVLVPRPVPIINLHESGSIRHAEVFTKRPPSTGLNHGRATLLFTGPHTITLDAIWVEYMY